MGSRDRKSVSIKWVKEGLSEEVILELRGMSKKPPGLEKNGPGRGRAGAKALGREQLGMFKEQQKDHGVREVRSEVEVREVGRVHEGQG